MRKKLLKFLALSLAFVLCVPTAGAARRGEEMVRVGLAYGSGALVGANLENNTGYGSGYRFGYFDGDVRFGDTPLHLSHLLGFAEKVRNKW